MLTLSDSLQGEPPLALGLSTRKALSVLKEQLEAVLEKHLKERKKSLTWKVKLPSGWPELFWVGREAGSPVSGPCACPLKREDSTDTSRNQKFQFAGRDAHSTCWGWP